MKWLSLLFLTMLIQAQEVYHLFDTEMQFVTMMVFYDPVSDLAYSTVDFGKNFDVIPNSIGMKYNSDGLNIAGYKGWMDIIVRVDDKVIRSC